MPRRDNSDNNRENKEVLKEAAAIQSNTKAALSRIQQQATATQEIGAGTLEELYEQRKQFEQIQTQGDRIHDALETTHRLQNQFSRWSWQFGTLRAAKRRANKVANVQAQRKERNKSRVPKQFPQQENESIEVIVTPHGKAKKKNSRHSTRSSSVSSTVVEVNSSSLLFGLSSKGSTNHTMMNDSYDEEEDELRPELEQLARTDDEINQGLHAVEVQLDEILNLAQTMGQEIQTQSKAMDEFTDQMEDMNHQTRIVNHRAGMFLVGRARKNYLVD